MPIRKQRDIKVKVLGIQSPSHNLQQPRKRPDRSAIEVVVLGEGTPVWKRKVTLPTRPLTGAPIDRSSDYDFDCGFDYSGASAAALEAQPSTHRDRVERQEQNWADRRAEHRFRTICYESARADRETALQQSVKEKWAARIQAACAHCSRCGAQQPLQPDSQPEHQIAFVTLDGSIDLPRHQYTCHSCRGQHAAPYRSGVLWGNFSCAEHVLRQPAAAACFTTAAPLSRCAVSLHRHCGEHARAKRLPSGETSHMDEFRQCIAAVASDSKRHPVRREPRPRAHRSM